MATNLTPRPFSDFPEDVQLCILSFLHPSELSAFAATSKLYLSLCRNDHRLWFAMCNRRFGSKTQIKKWGCSKISYKSLYRLFDRYDNLIGFWRRCGVASSSAEASLVFFEWGTSYITGSRILPSRNNGYGVIKKRFLWMSVTVNGEEVNYIDPDGRLEKTSTEDEELIRELGSLESELIRVDLSSIGESHMVVEENSGFLGFGRLSCSGNVNEKWEEFENVYGSPPDELMSEIYQYFANRTSPGGNGAYRRQRKREKAKQGGRRRWEPEYLVKITNFSPNPNRPLQGIWKGILEDMSLDFYLVSYDDIGGIACRKLMASNRPLAHHAPVFWSLSTTFTESPFSPEEDYIYNCRLHLFPPDETEQKHYHLPFSDIESVSRMLFINSSYDIVLPDLPETALNSRLVEGRVWQYGNGTFGFGFLRDNYVVDMKPIAKDGQLLDIIE